MYVPPHFREDRQDVLLAAMADVRLATFVTMDGGYHVSHAPVVVRDDGGSIALESHLARPNPHWQVLTEPRATVAIFQGPQAYISPSHYASKREHGKVVPTWNYIAVHAHGMLEAVDDAAWLQRHVSALTDANEAGRSEPWAVSDAPDRFIEKMTRGIVGIRLTVDRLEGSWKMTQQKTDADRQGVIAGLAASAAPADRSVAAVMAELEAARQ